MSSPRNPVLLVWLKSLMRNLKQPAKCHIRKKKLLLMNHYVEEATDLLWLTGVSKTKHLPMLLPAASFCQDVALMVSTIPATRESRWQSTLDLPLKPWSLTRMLHHHQHFQLILCRLLGLVHAGWHLMKCHPRSWTMTVQMTKCFTYCWRHGGCLHYHSFIPVAYFSVFYMSFGCPCASKIFWFVIIGTYATHGSFVVALWGPISV